MQAFEHGVMMAKCEIIIVGWERITHGVGNGCVFHICVICVC